MNPLRKAATALILVVLALATGTSYAGPPAGAGQSSELAGRTTVQTRVGGGSPARGFSFLSRRGGERHLVRQERLGTAVPDRSGRRRSLLYFAQLSDFQLADEESPARVEFLDVSADPPLSTPFGAAQRPQESLVAQAAEASVRQVNRFGRSPVRDADGRRAAMAFSVFTGDLADSQQLNEVRGVLTLLEGGPLDPNSGVTNQGCPPGTPGADEAARYTGVQDKDDHAEGVYFYDPDSPTGRFAGWPRWPGLMDRAQAKFTASGLRVPSYVAFGNHDVLVQGNAAALFAYEAIGTGCVKPMLSSIDPRDPFRVLDPAYLTGLVTTSPGKVLLVPRDPDRRYVDHRQFKEVFKLGQADAHGFAHVDAAEDAATDGHAGYYAWTPKPGFRFISVDTVSEGGIPGPSAEGNIDDPQWRWLERELAAAERADQLVVLFGHHPIRSLTSTIPDEAAGRCAASDYHDHGQNPGCDHDARSSTPIHRGDDLRELLLDHPHVIATVFGHTHENRVTPYARPGGGGFWGIESPSHIDWPIQSRLIEVMENGDGTLSVFGTVLDVDAPVRAPASGTPAAGFGVPELASVARTLAYNDPQAGGNAGGDGKGDGLRRDRNVELIVDDPRRSTAAGRCARAAGRLGGLSVGAARLGRTRSATRRAFPRRSLRRRRSVDRFCLAARRATRVGYRGRAAVAVSSHPAYALRKVRSGTPVRTLRRAFRGERRIRVGRSTWYLVRGRRATVVFRAARNRVREVGLASRRHTSTSARARALLRPLS